MKKQFTDYEIDGIDTKDYPDFCDAYILNANVIEGNETRQATDKELDELNENSALIHELVFKQLF